MDSAGRSEKRPGSHSPHTHRHHLRRYIRQCRGLERTTGAIARDRGVAGVNSYKIEEYFVIG